MRIALLPSAFHPSLGGVEELTRRLATSLIEAGHEVQVWTSQPPDDDVPGRETVDGIEVLRFTFPLPRANLVAAVKWPVPALAVLRDLRSAARSFSPDVLHVQCFSGNGMYAAALSRSMGIPLVISLQGETVMDDQDIFTRSRTLKSGLRWGLKQASAVTACSKFTLNDAIARFGAEPSKSRVIFNGVDLDERADEQPLDLPFDVFALAMGRVVHKKGFDLLLDACQLLDELPPRTGIVIGGDGPRLEGLRQQALRMGIADRVVFPGRLERSQVAWAMSNARCFVLPSRLEPFGIVILEAWRAGTAIIASNIGGAPEFVTEGTTGLLRNPCDVASLAQAVAALLNDAELAHRLGRSGESAVRAFDWVLLSREYTNLYAEVTHNAER